MIWGHWLMTQNRPESTLSWHACPPLQQSLQGLRLRTFARLGTGQTWAHVGVLSHLYQVLGSRCRSEQDVSEVNLLNEWNRTFGCTCSTRKPTKLGDQVPGCISCLAQWHAYKQLPFLYASLSLA